MHKLDEDILRAYFRLEEAQRQRLWMARVWHPETFEWKRRGGPPPITETKRIRQEELARLGFGEDYYQRMLAEEEWARTELVALAELHPLAVHFDRIKGLGLYLCGAFVAAGGDIERAPTVSAFWKGMGLDVLPDGSVPRRVRGNRGVDRRIPALPHVTRVGEQIRQQVLRSRGKLYEHYAQHRTEVDAAHPSRAKILNMKDALRRTQKMLYAALWKCWRQAYRLPAPEPYAYAILRHEGRLVEITDFYEPGCRKSRATVLMGEPGQRVSSLNGRAS